MNKIVEEPKLLGHKEVNGQQVPVYSCKTETVLTNKNTNETYESEEACTADIENPDTDTAEEHIQRDVTIFAPRLASLGASNKKE